MNKNIMQVCGGTFTSKMNEVEFDAFTHKLKPDALYAEVKLCDAKMRNLPPGWIMTKDSDYEAGIARCLWEDRHDAFFRGKNGCCYFDRDGNGSEGPGFYFDLYKVAVYQYEGYKVELMCFCEV